MQNYEKVLDEIDYDNIRFKEDILDLYLNIVETLLKLNRNEDAIDYCNKAIEVDNDDSFGFIEMFIEIKDKLTK